MCGNEIGGNFVKWFAPKVSGLIYQDCICPWVVRFKQLFLTLKGQRDGKRERERGIERKGIKWTVQKWELSL